MSEILRNVPTDEVVAALYNDLRSRVEAVEPNDAIVAPDYADLTLPILVGTRCTHNRGLYKCNTQINSSEAWTAAHWDEITVGSELDSLQSEIPDVSGKTDQGAVATPYASLTWPVTAGKYCFYNGYVYRAKQDIATSESWTAAHWDQVVLGDEVCRALNAIDGMRTATASDVGKALSPKTVANGKVTEWQFVEGGGSVDPSVIAEAVDDWLDDHPEATTTVEDGSISYEKLDLELKEDIDNLTSYLPINSGNMIDVSEYEGEKHRVKSEISVTVAETTFELYCCGKNHMKVKAATGGFNGFTWESRPDGTIVLNGTTDRKYELGFAINLGDVCCIYNTKWRASLIKETANNNVQILFNGLEQGDTYSMNGTATPYAKQLLLLIKKDATFDNYVVRPMVEFGDYSVEISYEVFKGFILNHTFDSAVTTGEIDWGDIDFPEDAPNLWMYNAGNITTIYEEKTIIERIDEIDNAVENAYAHEYVPMIEGWTDPAVSYSSGFIDSTGGVTENNNFRHSNFIRCVENDKITYNLYGYSSQVYIVTFYNSTKTKISNVVGTTGFKEGIIYAPENTEYVVFSTSNSFAGTFTVERNERISGDELVARVAESVDERLKIEKAGYKITRANANIVKDSIYTNQTGGFYTQVNGFRTDYIPVSEGDVVKYRCYSYIGTSLKTYTVTMFDIDKNIVDHIEASESGIINGTYTVEEGVAYVIISWLYSMYNQNGWFEITEATISQEVKEIVKKEEEIQSSPLNGKQWCCLGDSITYGANTTKIYANFIEDCCAVTPWNFGKSNTAIAKSSASVTDNITSRYAEMFDDADYVTVFGGTNDHGQGIPIGQWGDADQLTLYGAMKILCEGLIAKYIGKKIGFIIPLPKYSNGIDYSFPSESFKPYIDCIKDVCARYSIPVLDLYTQSGIAAGISAVRTAMIPDGLHPNATGHEFISRKIQTFLESL